MVRLPASRLAYLVAVLLGLLAPVLAHAAAGDLDVTFNPTGTTPSPGVATFDVSGSQAFELAQALVILPNGRIVVAVSTTQELSPGVFTDLCVLIGLTPSGALDAGFGTGGRVVLDRCAVTLKLQPDGVSGTFIAVSPGEVRRFTANGTLDTTFGASGVATSPAAAQAVVVQSDGKIVLAASSSGSAVVLGRLLPGGAPDPGFGPSPGGSATHDFGPLPTDVSISIRAVAILDDGFGSIVVGGRQFNPPNPPFFVGPQKFFVARFTSVGALDTDFHNPDGFVVTDFDGEQLRPLAIPALDPANTFAVLQSGVIGLVAQGGKVVAVGATQANVDDGDPANPGAELGSHRDFVLMARYGSNGQLDLTFGNTIDLVTLDPALDGRAYGPLGNAEDVAVQADGKIVASSFFGEAGLFGVARFLSNGVLDSTFGTGGVATTDFTGPPADPNTDFGSALAVGIQSNGKIVAAGAASQDPVHHSEDLDTRVVRYRGDSDVDDEGDTTPPTILNARVTPSILWPPLGQMVTVHVIVNATDDSGAPPTCSITQIQSSQPIGRTSPDFVITGPLTARLRAEISLLMGLRRTYTLTVSCQDAAGNTATTHVRAVATLFPFGF